MFVLTQHKLRGARVVSVHERRLSGGLGEGGLPLQVLRANVSLGRSPDRRVPLGEKTRVRFDAILAAPLD